MLINEVTEKVYVGKSTKDVSVRWREHIEDSNNGGSSKLHQAIRDWPEVYWSYVVLQFCHSELELAVAEENWIKATHCLDGAVGYNARSESVDRISFVGSVKAKTKKNMSEAEIEKFREYGRRALKKHPRSFYVECGKRAIKYTGSS